MADIKISQMVDGGTVQATDEIPVNRSGTNRKVVVGTAATQDFGTGVGDLVQFVDDGGGNAQYPAADGSQITGITADADNVNYDNTTSGLSASDVQDAIDELANEKVNKAGDTMTGNLTMSASYQVLLSTGVTAAGAGLPLAFDTDDNTGFYRPAADNMGWVAGGQEIMRVVASGSNYVARMLRLLQFAFGSTLASAATVDLGTATGNTVQISGTTTITGFGGTPQVGTKVKTRFQGALQLTNSANLITLTGSNMTTSAGDQAEWTYEGSSIWRMSEYWPVGGTTVGVNTVAKGGTGRSTLPAGQLLYGDGTNQVGMNANLNYDSSNNILVFGNSSSLFTTFAGLQMYAAGGVRMSFHRYSNDASSGGIAGYKSRSGTLGTNTIVQNGDQLLSVVGYGGDGTTYYGAGYMIITVDGAPTAGSSMPTAIEFYTAPTGSVSPSRRMKIGQDGAVRVNANGATPSASQSGVELHPTPTTSTPCKVATGTGGAQQIWNWFTPSGGAGNISLNGTTATYNASSDYRLKENVEEVHDPVEKLMKLKPVSFTWIKNPEMGRVDGFLAHEVQEIVPGAVTGIKDDVYEDGTIKPQGIDHSVLVPLLIASVQKMEMRIRELEIKLNTPV